MITTETNTTLQKGKKIYFTDEKLPYKVMAANDRYAVVVRPLNRREDASLLHYEVEMRAYDSFTEAYQDNKDSPIYSIIDTVEGVRAPDDLIFGIYDYFNESDCEKAIKDLDSGELSLSSRNRVKLSIDFNRIK